MEAFPHDGSAILRSAAGSRTELPYFRGLLGIKCVCGGYIHPIQGAWCVRCHAQVVELRVKEQPHAA